MKKYTLLLPPENKNRKYASNILIALRDLGSDKILNISGRVSRLVACILVGIFYSYFWCSRVFRLMGEKCSLALCSLIPRDEWRQMRQKSSLAVAHFKF